VRDRGTTNRATQQHAKAKIESIEMSATAGAMTGNAPSKKQATFERFRWQHFTLHWQFFWICSNDSARS
jgi:hypothetical protein